MAKRIEIEIVGDAKNFQTSLGKASGSADSFGHSLAKLGKLAAVAGLAVSAGLAVGLKKSVESAVDFERAMRNVNSIAVLSEKGFGNLQKSVLSMAAAVGQKPKVLAEGLYAIVSSGFKANDAVKILAVSAKAATAGLTDTSTATKAVTAALNAYHQGAGKAREVSDILFQTVNKGVLTFEELSQQMGDLVPASAPLGVSLKEVGAGMATLTLQGVPAAEAATRMKNAMLALAKPTPALSALLKEQGFASGEAAIKSEGFAGVLDILSKATGGSVAAQAKLTPEIRTLLGVVGLTGKNLATYNTILKSMDEATRDAGITARVFAEQSKGVAVGWQKVNAALEVVKIQLGTALLPVLKTALGHLSKFLAEFSKAEGASAKFQVAMDALKGIAAAAATGLVSVFNNIDWSKTWDGLVASAGTIATRLRDALDQKLGAVDWGNVGAKIADGITNAIEAVGAVGKKISDTIMVAMRTIDWVAVGRVVGPGLAAALVVAFTTLIDPAFWVKNWDLALAVALVAFTGPLGKLGAGLIAPFKRLGGDIVLGITSGIESFAPRIAKVVLDALSGLPGLITKMLGALLGPVKTGFAKLGALASFVVKILGVSAAINAIVGFARDVAAWLVKVARYFTDLRGKIMGAFAGAAGWLVGAGASILQGLWDGLKSKWEAVASWVGGLGSKIQGLKGPESKDATLLTPHGKAIILGLETGMLASWATLAPKINALGGDIISNFIMGVSAKAPQFTGKLAEAATNALEAARAVVEGFQVKLGDAFGRLGDYAKRAFEAKVKGMADGIAREFEAKIGGIKAFQASLTPAELQLQQMDAAEQARQRASALTAAQAALSKAETMDAGVEKEAAVAAAKEQIRVAEAANIRVGLEEQAALERTHRDQAAALQITFLEEAKAKELANLEERTQQQGTALATQLTQLQNRLATHPAEYDKIQAKIIKLLNGYGVSFKKSGLALGNAFAAGIRASVAEVERAAKAVAAAAAKYLPHSPAEKGPLSKPVDWSGYIMDGFANTIRMAGAAASGPFGGGGAMGAVRAPAAAMSGGGGGNTYHFAFPHYVGDRRELVDAVRTEVRRVTARNG